MFFAAGERATLQFLEEIDHFIEADLCGVVSYVLGEGVLDDFQYFFLADKGYVGMKQRPEEITIVLVEQALISYCMLYM